MNSIRNLKDAGKMLPAWTLPLVLSTGIIGAFLLARSTMDGRPHELVSLGTLYAVIGSIAIAVITLVFSIVEAKPGELLASIEEGFIRGLNFMWSTSSVALVVYAGAVPAYTVITNNVAASLAAAVAAAVLCVAHYVSNTKKAEPVSVDPISGLPTSTAMAALPLAFTQTQEQRPAFQVSMADLTRLMIHQSGRLIAYKGSNCVFEDSFSADLDINARTAKIFAEMNLIATPQFLFWRLHMLMIGSAAEHVLRNTTSEAALDDLANFDELAGRYMVLNGGSSSFSRPASDAEAAIKATRIGMLRKQVWSRCVNACAVNKRVLLDLVRLMRGQSCLAYGDIKHLLDRVVMPADFPVAEFDTDDMMERTFLAISRDEDNTIDAVAEATPTSDAEHQTEDAGNVYAFTHA